MGNRFLKGAMILSISLFATKFLGILYVIPFQRLVGETGMALYQYAYTPYSLFINLSTLGIPVGIAKFISKYNAAGEYDTSRKIFRYGTLFMFVLGIVGFFTLYTIAPWYANQILAGKEALYNTHEDVTMAIRTISFALLVIPPMAIFRGFFQGNQNMVPTSVSQFVEQLTRVFFILVGSYIIVNLRGGTTQEAVAFSVFSAFLAGVTAYIVLCYFWFKNKNHYNQLLEHSVSHPKRQFGTLFSELISYAIPFAVLGMATNLFQIVDNVTFHEYMIQGAGVEPIRSEQLMGMYGGFLYKIIMIPVSFAIAFGQPLVPELTFHLTEGNQKEVRRTLMLAIQLTCFVTIPAVIGMSILAHPIYLLFFSSPIPELNELGGQIFQTGAFLGLFMALYSITTAILQGIGAQLYGILFLVIALVIKYVGNVVFIPYLEVDGAILATILAYGVCIMMSLIIVKKKIGFSFRHLFHRLLPIIIFTGAMAAVTWILKMVLSLFIDYQTSFVSTLIYIVVIGTTGVFVYLGLAWYFDLMKSLFGFRVSLKGLKKPNIRHPNQD